MPTTPLNIVVVEPRGETFRYRLARRILFACQNPDHPAVVERMTRDPKLKAIVERAKRTTEKSESVTLEDFLRPLTFREAYYEDSFEPIP